MRNRFEKQSLLIQRYTKIHLNPITRQKIRVWATNLQSILDLHFLNAEA